MKIMRLVELPSQVGAKFGPSRPRIVTQQQVDLFAEATDDHHWQHVDVERARQGPFSGTIAHGYLTLSLVPSMLDECLQIEGSRMGLNYGVNRLRFPAPVRVGTEIQLTGRLTAVTPIDGGFQVQIAIEVNAVSAPKPCVAGEIVYNYYGFRSGSRDGRGA